MMNFLENLMIFVAMFGFLFLAIVLIVYIPAFLEVDQTCFLKGYTGGDLTWDFQKYCFGPDGIHYEFE